MKLKKEHFEPLIKLALAEDLTSDGDITSNLLITAKDSCSARFLSKEDMIFCGADILKYFFPKGKLLKKDGDKVKKGEFLFDIKNHNTRDILKYERTALNIIQRMSGVATQTARYVKEISSTNAKLLDTRKTSPAMRYLDKYAVKTGGGVNHRIGLFDEIMVKDNHIQAIGGIENLPEALKGVSKTKIIIECDTLEQAKLILESKIKCRILLDNMTPRILKLAVKMRNEINKKIPLEASGGVTLKNIKKIAKSGVDFISTGAITHSVKNTDISLDFY